MFEPNRGADFANASYQAELARSLLAAMDLEDAIDFCVGNEWFGVLEHLLRSLDVV